MAEPLALKAILRERRITQRALGHAVGCNPKTLNRVLGGHLSSWPALRRRCSEYLEMPEGLLFVPAEDQEQS